ncbi:hypothetical protein [Helicobacter sp. T3_23-1056]
MGFFWWVFLEFRFCVGVCVVGFLWWCGWFSSLRALPCNAWQSISLDLPKTHFAFCGDGFCLRNCAHSRLRAESLLRSCGLVPRSFRSLAMTN